MPNQLDCGTPSYESVIAHGVQVEDKASEARTKEDERMAPFRAIVGGGPIIIPKREHFSSGPPPPNYSNPKFC
jgi:hypothetical protein